MLELEWFSCKNRMIILISFTISLEPGILLKETNLLLREDVLQLFMEWRFSSPMYSERIWLSWVIFELWRSWERKPTLMLGLLGGFLSCTNLLLGSYMCKFLLYGLRDTKSITTLSFETRKLKRPKSSWTFKITLWPRKFVGKVIWSMDIDAQGR